VYIPSKFQSSGYIIKKDVAILLSYVIFSDFTKNNLALRVAFCEQFGGERVKQKKSEDLNEKLP
jgi:hypothetical protein